MGFLSSSTRPVWRAAVWGAAVGAGVGGLLSWLLNRFAVPLDIVGVVTTTAFCIAVGGLATVVARLLGRGVRSGALRVVIGLILIPPALAVTGDLLYSLLVKRADALNETRLQRDSDGVRIGWREYTIGSGQTALLFVHGFGNSPVMFQRMAPALAESGFTCEVMRLPGAGERIESAARATADEWVEAVRRRLQALRQSHRRVVIVAHSMGCAVALDAVAEHADLADALVLMAPMLEVSPLRSPLLSPRGWHQVLDPLLLFTDRMWLPFPPDMNDPEGAALIQGERCRPRSVYRQLFTLIDRNRGRARSLPLPILVMLAPNDPVIDNAAAERFFDECPTLPKRLRYLERSNHNIPLDYDWREAVDEIRQFE
jgi:esterase/lipase